MSGDAVVQLCWIGSCSAEFAAARAAAGAQPNVNIGDFPDLRAAAAWLAASETAPELIVITQTRPGEIPAAEIDLLRRLAPLTRLVGLLGTWCEGESRSGQPWPAVERVYWHQWPAWFTRELHGLRTGAATTWSLPLTTAPEERFLAASHMLPRRQFALGGKVLIVASDSNLQRLLLDAMTQVGCGAVTARPEHLPSAGVSLLLWESDELKEDEAEQLRTCAQNLAPAPAIALLGFPRLEAEQRALAAGARHVLSKPFFLSDVLAAIDREVNWALPLLRVETPSCAAPTDPNPNA